MRLSTFCLHLSRLSHKDSKKKQTKKRSLTFHLNIHCFRRVSPTKTGARLFKTLNRECLCSYFARRLFCRCTNIPLRQLLPSSSHVSFLCTGVIVLFPPRLRQEAAFFFSLTALVDWLHPYSLLQSETEFIFSVLAPSPPQKPVSKNVFSIGSADQMCLSLCECVYITVHVWKNKMGSFLLRAGAFSVHVNLRADGSPSATCSASSESDRRLLRTSVCLLHVLFLLTKTFLTSSQ